PLPCSFPSARPPRPLLISEGNVPTHRGLRERTMKPSRNDHGAYVRKVQAGTQNFAQDLMGELERMQVLVAALEAEKESQSDKAREVREALRANEALRALAASLEAEMNRLHEQAISLRQENERHLREQARLQSQQIGRAPV